MMLARLTLLLPLAVAFTVTAPRAAPPCGVPLRGASILGAAKKGFGAKVKAKRSPPRDSVKTKPSTRDDRGGGGGAPVVQLDDDVRLALDALDEAGGGIENYLNPALFEDPATMRDVGARLRAGDVVVLKDAFRDEFAQAVHAELAADTVDWALNEAYFADGYHHRHHNAYDARAWSARLRRALGVFADERTRAFMSELAGRDCAGDATGAPSWYKAGDHSLPHTDWVGQRTVAYVWHLSKGWRPEWGGALYWAGADHAVATHPASFNTLVLFCVTTTSAHFVTTVSPHHEGKRLTFNGWWQSAWLPQEADAELDAVLADEARGDKVTHAQLQAIADVLADPWQNIDAARRERLDGQREALMRRLFPRGARAGVEA